MIWPRPWLKTSAARWLTVICLFSNSLAFGTDLNPRTPHQFLSDGGYVVTAPFRTDQSSFWLASGAVGLTLGSSLLDRSFRSRLFPSLNTASAKNLRTFGDGVQVLGPLIGTGFLISGTMTDNDRVKETGYLVDECFIWSAVFEGGINFLVGRQRPLKTDNPYSFQPFHINTSFPSGHTTQAFAAATVFTEQYPHWYVAVPAYSVAAVTGFSRMYSSKHWMSDVVGGGLLGMFIAHTIRTHHRREDQKDKTAWHFSTDGNNLLLVRKF